jgi:DNA-binding NtrC family response regulator
MEHNQLAVLLVADEQDALASLAESIRSERFSVMSAAGGAEALILARSHRLKAAVIRESPELDGTVVMAELRNIRPGLPGVLLSGRVEDGAFLRACEAMDCACFDSGEMASLREYLQRISSHSRLGVSALAAGNPANVDPGPSPNEDPDPQPTPHRPPPPRLIGETRAMQELKKTITKVGGLDCTVLLRGETGVGKELAARLIHQASPRAGNRFLAVSCASLSPELLSNELFGHEQEAFSGAQHTRKGIFEATSGGTILLDEIGETPRAMQAQLLRVLQEKTIIRLGGAEEIPVDVRLIAASNESLKTRLEEGSFREDLYYRLNAFTIRIPPLRERREDIPALCSYFLQKYNRDFDKQVKGFADEVMERLMHYPFPGNVRELENVVERAVILCEDRTVRTGHLPDRFRSGGLPQRQPRGRSGFVTLAELEADYIQEVLEATGGNKSESAKILGINRASLWRKLKRLQEGG